MFDVCIHVNLEIENETNVTHLMTCVMFGVFLCVCGLCFFDICLFHPVAVLINTVYYVQHSVK